MGGSLASWTTLPTQYGEVTSNGLHVSPSASLLFVRRLTLKVPLPAACRAIWHCGNHEVLWTRGWQRDSRVQAKTGAQQPTSDPAGSISHSRRDNPSERPQRASTRK